MARIECALCDELAEFERDGYVYCPEHFRRLFRIAWFFKQRRVARAGRHGRTPAAVH